jgi:malonate transporter and related proteins
MALFVTGLIVSAQHFRFTWNTALATLTANVLQPVLAFGIARLLSAPPQMLKIAVVMAALPAGFFGILFGESYGQKSQEASSQLIASTAAAVLTLAVAIAWVFR